MVNPQQIDAHGEQVVLSAQYSSRRWLWGMGFTLLAIIGFYAANRLILRGDYIRGIAGAVGGSICLLYALDAMLTNAIIFYQDRVVKIWHFLGRRTIFYSKAKVYGAPRNRREQRSKWYQITEIKDNGRRLLFQIPIVYKAQFVSPQTANRIDMIVDYLTGKNENRTRIFPSYGRRMSSECDREVMIVIVGKSPAQILCTEEHALTPGATDVPSGSSVLISHFLRVDEEKSSDRRL